MPLLRRLLRSRLGLPLAYASPRRNFPLRWSEVATGLLAPPCQAYAQREITSIEPVENDLLKVKLRRLDPPFYFPASLDRHWLELVVTEAFRRDHPHRYDVAETPLREGDIVIDAGAAEGLFGLQALAAGARQVFLFEPASVFQEGLRRTFAPFPGAVIVKQALGSKPGTAHLQTGSLHSQINGQVDNAEAVEIVTLDDYCARQGIQPTFLKGDLEGFEEEVLRGATKILRTAQPRVAFTTYHPRNDWQTMVSLITEAQPAYQWRVKGLTMLDGRTPKPQMLHAWVA